MMFSAIHHCCKESTCWPDKDSRHLYALLRGEFVPHEMLKNVM